MNLHPAADSLSPAAPLQKHAPMRLLMTVDAVGGVWRYAMTLARALAPLGYRTSFVGFGPRPSPEQKAEARRIGRLSWYDLPLEWMVDDEARLEDARSALAFTISRTRPDIVHVNTPALASGLDPAIPMLVAAHSCVVTWWASMKHEPLPPRWRWQKAANASTFGQARAIVTPSGSHADLMARSYGRLPGLDVVYNGIGDVTHGDAKEKLVVAAGRWWDEGKNGAVLDRAAADIEWPLVMAGPVASPSGDASLELANARSAGEIAHADLMRLVRRAGIVVSPSRYEPFGLAALEGGRAGAALVLSDIPTYREIWADAALYFDPHDAKALAAQIRRLIAEPDLRSEMSMRALARSRRYAPHIQAASMADIYSRMLGWTPARQAAE